MNLNDDDIVSKGVNESLNNPILARCTSNKCRKIIYLRNNTFLEHFPRTPASIIFKIIYIWINEKSNANDIYQKLKNKNINYDICKEKILSIFKVARYYISNYYKHIYKLEEFSEFNKNERFAIDESFITSLDNEQWWIIGIINNTNKNFRLEFSRFRNENILKKINNTISYQNRKYNN